MAYFSNGTEGIAFDLECQDCILGDESCPIALIQTTYNYDQCSNAKVKEILDILVNSNAECSMKKQFPEHFKIDAVQTKLTI